MTLAEYIDAIEVYVKEWRAAKGLLKKASAINIGELLDSYWKAEVVKSPKNLYNLMGQLNSLVPPSLRWELYSMYSGMEELMHKDVNTFYDNLDKNYFYYTPSDLFDVAVPKKKYDPSDLAKYEIAELLSPFVGGDELRPFLSGINFSEKSAVATDANMMAHVPSYHIPFGTYGVKKRGKKIDLANEIDETYPNWRQILPSSAKITKTVSTERVYRFLKGMEKVKGFPSTTKAWFFNIYDDEDREAMGANSVLMLEALKFMLLLGYTEIDMNFTGPNRAIVITPVGEMDSISKGNVPFALVMPVRSDYANQHKGYPLFDIESGEITLLQLSDLGEYRVWASKTGKKKSSPKKKPDHLDKINLLLDQIEKTTDTKKKQRLEDELVDLYLSKL